ncbi:MAG: hypothetical protein QMD21_06220 [Candidatus Thermoplasmatota archaeon]|nr:hypothetical protein [Candidatus Thermoplasmatota archaeon]
MRGEIDVIYDKVIDYFKSLNFELKQSLFEATAVKCPNCGAGLK